MSEPAITTDDLSRHFGTLAALDGLDLRVERGEVFGFLGPNGAGKTTTMHLLLGILRPTRGHASVLGLDPRRQAPEVRRRCGALLEHHGVYERLSALENLDFQGRMYGLSAAERRDRARGLLEEEGLWERRHDHVGTWSRGMKQRLAIARALMPRPDLVFLDEPTAGFDPQGAHRLRKTIRALADEEGVTVFLNTHHLHEAEAICDQVGILFQGRLLVAGPPDQLRESDGGPTLRLRGDRLDGKVVGWVRARRDVVGCTGQGGELLVSLKDGAEPWRIVQAVVRAGGRIDQVDRIRSDLESDFLALVEDVE